MTEQQRAEGTEGTWGAPPAGAVRGRLADGSPVRVEFDGDRISAVVPDPGSGTDVVLPGLVDLQVNGYAGHDVNAPGLTAEDVAALVRAQWRLGVTTLLPTLVSAPEEHIVAALRTIARARAADPLVRHSVPGVHVEGPSLSPEDGPRGAHDVRHLRDPDPAEFERWQRSCGGLVRMVTLAPERDGALGYIRALTAAGVLVALGHTAAEPACITAAVDAGARLSTHLGNGSHLMVRRHPNHLWSQLAEDRLTATFIADGHHLPPEAFTAMLRAKGVERAVLVSDSTALAGRAPGEYTTPVGGRVTVRADGRLTLPGSGLLAGSGRSLTDCVRWASTATELDLAAAVRLAAANPARVLGLPDRGRIAVGARADLAVFARDGAGALSPLRTIVGGRTVHAM